MNKKMTFMKNHFGYVLLLLLS